MRDAVSAFKRAATTTIGGLAFSVALGAVVMLLAIAIGSILGHPVDVSGRVGAALCLLGGVGWVIFTIRWDRELNRQDKK